MLNLNKCENCGNDHNGEYGSGRFCSSKCARGFSTKAKRAEINEKVSKTLLRNNGYTEEEIKIIKEEKIKHSTYIRDNEPLNLFDLSKRTITKVMKRMNLPCSLCNWYVEGVVCDIHHIVSRKHGGTDEHTNLTYVCPNCHRLIHNDKINESKIVPLESYIGDKWKKFYYVKYNKIMDKNKNG